MDDDLDNIIAVQEAKDATRNTRVITADDLDFENGMGYVRLSNEFITSRHKFTLVESRLLALAISRKGFEDKIPRVVSVHAEAFAAEYGLDISVAYKQLRETAKSLFEQYIQIGFDGNAAGYSEYRLFEQWTAYEDGTISLHFSDRFLTELNQKFVSYFVSYKQKYTRGLLTDNAFRLYQLLMVKYHRKAKKGVAEFKDWELLKKTMKLDDRYPLYANFKKRVLMPALVNISECSELVITSFKPIKKGRKVTGFIIEFEENPQQKLDL